MENMAYETEKEVALTVGELFSLLWRRLWAILLAAVIVGGALFAYRYYTYTEEYTSTAQMFVLNSEALEDATSPSAYSYYYSLALSIMEDCSELLLSDTVMSQVIEDLNLDTAPAILRRTVDINFEEKSRILRVSVTTGNPDLSCEIVNSLCKFGVVRIGEITGGNQASVFEYGKVSRMPSNDVDLLLPIIAGVGMGALVYAVFLICMVLDDKIKDPEDVEKYLGLTVLGLIPTKDAESGKGTYRSKKIGKNRGRYYGRYYMPDDRADD